MKDTLAFRLGKAVGGFLFIVALFGIVVFLLAALSALQPWAASLVG